ncbi:FAR1 DNA binding domain-containing protein [Cynara cardunculus var. scolymus]|uniref:FAR1 DNA binding domain-containing protein n=1 Tax=Cynara cardunculus var. scolymus TaxID=59895 RepID=A0A103YNJ2_CYNCS|nr:FAR1 DNA binding domain-containing protein [Cynara cardunculus var. scolymus]
MKNNGKNPIDSSIHVNSDEDRVYVNSHEENVDVMKVVTWEASEEFDVGLSPFTDVQRNCEEIGLVDDIETHVIDDSTGYTSNNEIQNDESPVVEEVIKPVIGYVYPSLDVAESIYQKYAESAGFEVRRSTQKINPDGVIQNKYFVCSRFGLPLKKSFDSMVRRKHQRELRNSNIKRIGCTTSVKFRLMKGTTTYECYGFEEDHNHSLLRHDDMDLTRKGRQMKFSDQRFFSYDLLNNTTFKKQNFKLVWNIHISPDEFESRWMVQTEIHRAAWTCSIKSVNSNEEAETYLIEHLDKRDEKIAEYKVVRNLKESTVVCSCNHHRHVFKVLLNAGVETIPEEYILRRWRSDLIPIELQNSRQRICDVGEDQRRIINDTYEIVDDVLDILRNDKEKLESFVVKLREMRDDVAKDRTYEPSMKRKERGIEQILGFTRPDNIEIHPATGIRNKGCGTSKRLIGAAEKAAVNSSRPKRMCRGCNMLSNHDIRNCPNKKK